MRTAVKLSGVGGALVLGALCSIGCRSMDKAKIESALLGLDKNSAVSAAGLETRDAEVRIAGETVRARFSWHRAGERGRPVVVLVHGTPGSLFTWTDLVHGGAAAPGATDAADVGPAFGLARDFDVYALDVIGHGATRTELPSYAFQSCADWVSAFLDLLDLRDVTLVGHSYGGEFAWRAALDRPERVGRVVLIDSAGIPRRDGEWLPEEVKLREWSIARWGWIVHSRSRLLGALQPHFAEPVPDERLEEYHLASANADNWRCMTDLCRDENGSRAVELASLAAPVLLLWGERDVAYRPERFAREFERRLPRAKLVLVEGAGHYPHEEQPVAVAREIRAFVSASPAGTR